MPLPPIDSIVNVYETTVPSSSETTRCVVDWRGWPGDGVVVTAARAAEPWSSKGSPAATGAGRRARRVDQRAALGGEARADSSPANGTSK